MCCKAVLTLSLPVRSHRAERFAIIETVIIAEDA